MLDLAVKKCDVLPETALYIYIYICRHQARLTLHSSGNVSIAEAACSCPCECRVVTSLGQGLARKYAAAVATDQYPG